MGRRRVSRGPEPRRHRLTSGYPLVPLCRQRRAAEGEQAGVRLGHGGERRVALCHADLGEHGVGVDRESVRDRQVLGSHRSRQRDVDENVGRCQHVSGLVLTHPEPSSGWNVPEGPPVAQPDGRQLVGQKADPGCARVVLLVGHRIVAPRLVPAVLQIPDLVTEVANAQRERQRVPQEAGEGKGRGPAGDDDAQRHRQTSAVCSSYSSQPIWPSMARSSSALAAAVREGSTPP